MSRKLGLIPVLLALAFVCGPSAVRAASYHIHAPTGGDCATIGGIWVAGSSSCLVNSFTLFEDDGLLIGANAAIQFLSQFINHGVVQNDGIISGAGSVFNHGSFTTENTMLVTSALVNQEGAQFENDTGGMMQATALSAIYNAGHFINRDEIALEIDEAAPSESVFYNVGTMMNTGTLSGGATQSHPGITLFNQGYLDNAFGLIRNVLVDNEGLLEGGTIDDTGGAKSFVVNRAGAKIDGAEITFVKLENLGVIDNHIFGSGTITNAEGSLIRALGGQSFLVVNDGVIDILGDFEMFNTFTNNASGILVNRGEMVSHALLTNHGLFDNREAWFNDGSAVNQGVIDNFGTLLNASFIVNCGQFPNTEEVNNFGTLSNGGQISSCGSTNRGTWHECGTGGAPAEAPVIPGLDADADGVCSAVDCGDDDPNSWATPTVVDQLRVSDADQFEPTEYSWSEPFYAGGAAAVYDLVSSSSSDDFLGSGTCVADNVSGNVLNAPTPAHPGETLYFLVRASGCADGPAGFDSSGAPRELPGCP